MEPCSATVATPEAADSAGGGSRESRRATKARAAPAMVRMPVSMRSSMPVTRTLLAMIPGQDQGSEEANRQQPAVLKRLVPASMAASD